MGLHYIAIVTYVLKINMGYIVQNSTITVLQEIVEIVILRHTKLNWRNLVHGLLKSYVIKYFKYISDLILVT